MLTRIVGVTFVKNIQSAIFLYNAEVAKAKKIRKGVKSTSAAQLVKDNP